MKRETQDIIGALILGAVVGIVICAALALSGCTVVTIETTTPGVELHMPCFALERSERQAREAKACRDALEAAREAERQAEALP